MAHVGHGRPVTAMPEDDPHLVSPALRVPASHLAPLTGIRVVELAQGLAAPWCAMQLGDAGADVVKVEPPEGDYLRASGGDGHESDGFLALNRNKRGLVLDPADPEQGLSLHALVAMADVLVTDLGPAERLRLELDDRT